MVSRMGQGRWLRKEASKLNLKKCRRPTGSRQVRKTCTENSGKFKPGSRKRRKKKWKKPEGFSRPKHTPAYLFQRWSNRIKIILGRIPKTSSSNGKRTRSRSCSSSTILRSRASLWKMSWRSWTSWCKMSALLARCRICRRKKFLGFLKLGRLTRIICANGSSSGQA